LEKVSKKKGKKKMQERRRKNAKISHPKTTRHVPQLTPHIWIHPKFFNKDLFFLSRNWDCGRMGVKEEKKKFKRKNFFFFSFSFIADDIPFH